MKTLKTAVLGLGRIGWQTHIPSVLQHPGFTLAGVLDPLPERLEEARKEFGADGFTDYAELLDRTKPDLVVIASPTHFHADQAIAAMERGIDVFCDKPLAPSLAEVDRMIAAAQRTGRKLMTYQPHRATSEAAALRHIIGEGLLGPLFMLKHTVSFYTRRNDWQALKQFGGGMLNNYGAHYIDQVLYLTGASAAKITCALRKIASLGDADDVVKGLIEMDNGLIIDVEINMAAALPMSPWYVMGAQGTAAYTDDRTAFTAQYLRPDELPPLELNVGLAAAGRQYGSGEALPWRTAAFPLADFPPLNYYDKVYDYYALDQAPFVPVAQTREVMRILDACRSSAGWA